MSKLCEVCEILKEKNNFQKRLKICKECSDKNKIRCKGECNEVLDKSLFKYGRKVCNECFKQKDKKRYNI